MGIGLALILLLLANFGVSLIFSNKIFPGVTMNGVQLSRMDLQHATVSITTSSNFPLSGLITLTDGERSWEVKPVELGIFLDAQASAQNAFDAGRRGSILEVLQTRFKLMQYGMAVQPTFIYNENTALNYLSNLAKQIDQPLREASISISGTEVIVNNGQAGRVLDIKASLAAITRQVELMQDGIVPLVIIESTPVVLDASIPGELARGILSQPLQLTLPADFTNRTDPWQIEPVTLAKILTFETVANGSSTELQVVVSKPLMASYLESIRNETDVTPENARFIFNDETRQLDLLTPAVIGRNLNIATSIENINLSLKNNSHSADIAFDLTPPAITDSMTGAELGITELVTAYTTYFRGSSADRIQNIKTASSRFHGLLVPPGAVLSMSDVLGNISLDNGYAEAMIILGDQTIKGVGGGVCQVSTALFRTAYFSGLEILERHAHAYRVGYYEQTAGGRDQNLAGLDATVFVPLVDFKFRNDTEHWLLMETYMSSSNYSLTWKFYSTKDGRVVDSNTTGPTNIVDAPDPLYRENPDLATGTVKQVDWPAEGADVVVTRTVTRSGSVLYQDTFATHYQAWQAVYEYGPGTENMPPPKEPASPE
jgi:vancomycin resistance protein YoaR